MPRPPGAAPVAHDPTSGHAEADARDAVLAAGGDERAYERVYRRHHARVRRLARWLLARDDVDDVLQEVFIRAWRKLGTYRGEAALATWLSRLAVNVILRHRAAGRAEMAMLPDEEAGEAMTRSATEAQMLGIDIESAVARLPDGARAVFVLHDVQGFRHEEIAGMLGIEPHTSRSQLHRARMALRRHLR